MEKRGTFITFEGPEGAGKSTQLELLAARIRRELGREVSLTREPGGTPLAEEFRRILKHHSDPLEPIQPLCELLLFEAGRVQNIHTRVLPELAAGKVVLCDRFADSTLAYQGYARGLPLESVRRLNSLAAEGLKIDLTILLDLPPEAGFARAAKRASTAGGYDRLESETLEFHRRVREGFLAIAASEPRRVKVFDATLERDRLAADIFTEVSRVLA